MANGIRWLSVYTSMLTILEYQLLSTVGIVVVLASGFKMKLSRPLSQISIFLNNAPEILRLIDLNQMRVDDQRSLRHGYIVRYFDEEYIKQE